jgi:hypothetical protein
VIYSDTEMQKDVPAVLADKEGHMTDTHENTIVVDWTADAIRHLQETTKGDFHPNFSTYLGLPIAYANVSKPMLAFPASGDDDLGRGDHAD